MQLLPRLYLLYLGAVVFRYSSGEEILAGDRIIYAGSPGEVKFVLTKATGNNAMDWYLTVKPNGCFMIETTAMGSILLGEPDEDLGFVSRKTA